MESKNSCLLSVIVPVYNCEKYLKACLDSLLNQNFENYEIICVNDGSSDGSLQILSDYEKYSRIKVINKKNGGVSSARNAGLNSASGKWIWFVDSDDYVPFNCLNYLVSQLDDDIDYLAFDYDKADKIQEISFNNGITYNKIFMNSTIECLTTFPTKNYGNSPVSYIFKKEIILKNDIVFDCEMKYAEDTKFVFEYKAKCRRAKLIDGVFYYYFQRPSSAMHTVDHTEHFKAMQKLVSLYFLYAKDLQEGILKDTVNEKCIAAVKAVQFDLLLYIKDFELAKQIISEYEYMGIYPYKSGSIGKNKNKKQFIINCIYKFFPKKGLYLFFVKAYSKLSK